MTDREKLEQSMTELYNSLAKSPFPEGSIMYAEGQHLVMQRKKWQPTNRPCFDKPAGVPILHGETL